MVRLINSYKSPTKYQCLVIAEIINIFNKTINNRNINKVDIKMNLKVI